MKTMLDNIEAEIASALRKTIGTIGSRALVEIVAGGPGRV